MGAMTGAMRHKRLPMGALEDAVMDVMWSDDAWMAPSEVLVQLVTVRDLAYTTVTTTMVRLFEKGRLERRREGRAFAYHATSTRTQWSAQQMDKVLEAATDRRSTLTHFLDQLNDADRKQLRRMLTAKGRRSL
jgi:predicted transcriptional regulator